MIVVKTAILRSSRKITKSCIKPFYCKAGDGKWKKKKWGRDGETLVKKDVSKREGKKKGDGINGWLAWLKEEEEVN